MAKILPRYLFFQHFQFLSYYLLGGCGIYLLIDIFDRLDNFIKKDAPFEIIVKYFLLKIPLIISQILPVVYLIALITFFYILKRKNELIALQSGGISFFSILIIFLIYSLFWSGVEFSFSQVFGAISERKCSSIWNSMGKRKRKKEVVKDIWFRDRERIYYVERFYEKDKVGYGIKILFLNKNFDEITALILAKKVHFKDNMWSLKDVKKIDFKKFRVIILKEMNLYNMPLIEKMILLKKEKRVEELTPWRLRRVISSLKRSGTSVDSLLFIWHKKIAYSLSIFFLTLFAFCLIKNFDSLFWLLSSSLTVVFLLYVLFNFSEHLFIKGSIPFWLGAWLADILAFVLSILWFWVDRKKFF